VHISKQHIHAERQLFRLQSEQVSPHQWWATGWWTWIQKVAHNCSSQWDQWPTVVSVPMQTLSPWATFCVQGQQLRQPYGLSGPDYTQK